VYPTQTPTQRNAYIWGDAAPAPMPEMPRPTASTASPTEQLIAPVVMQSPSSSAGSGDETTGTCEAGMYYWGQYLTRTFCLKCPVGQTSKACSDCSPDPKGKRCSKICSSGEFMSSNAVCKSCPPGKWVADSSLHVDCTCCLPGRYQRNESSTTACLPCPKSKFAALQASSECSTCADCAQGQYLAESGAALTSREEACVCKVCPMGKFSPVGVLGCSVCTAGTYSSVQTASSCLRCPMGKYCAAGRSRCRSCPVGKYSAPGSSHCKRCTEELAQKTVPGLSVCSEEYVSEQRSIYFGIGSSVGRPPQGWQLMHMRDVHHLFVVLAESYNINRGLVRLQPWRSTSCCVVVADIRGGAHARLWAGTSEETGNWVFPANRNSSMLACNPSGGYIDSHYKIYGMIQSTLEASTSVSAASGAHVYDTKARGYCGKDGDNPGLFVKISRTNSTCRVFKDIGNIRYCIDSDRHEVQEMPNVMPTSAPSTPPTKSPSAFPTEHPTLQPTRHPTPIPTGSPTASPTPDPSAPPTMYPTSASPTPCPTGHPSRQPTAFPTRPPTASPTQDEAKIQPCIVSNWSAWGDCIGCGVGDQFRSRAVLQKPTEPVFICPALFERRVCIPTACVNQCNVSAWGRWGVCLPKGSLKRCGTGSQHKSRTVVPAYMGVVCSNATKQSRSCLFNKPCLVDCKVSVWSKWSTCKAQGKTCGTSGSKLMSRSVVAYPKHGGRSCPRLLKFKPCNTAPCPVDCALSLWGPWGACSVTAGVPKRHRQRSVLHNASFGGRPCGALKGAKVLAVTCKTPSPSPELATAPPLVAPIPTAGPKTAFPSMSPSESPTIAPSKMPTQHPSPQPTPSPTSLPTSPTSLPTQSPTSACVASPWGAWGSCSVTCGTGLQISTRKVGFDFDGTPCPTSRSSRCDLDTCAVPCKMSEWSSWSPCTQSCGSGRQHSSRKITASPKFGGSCLFLKSRARSCNTKPCCSYTPWDQWGKCNTACGGYGNKVRRRSPILPHSSVNRLQYMLYCMNSTTETQQCFDRTAPDCAVHCQPSAWLPWGKCSKSCGQGTRERTRLIVSYASYGGQPCGATNQTQACSLISCPVDCVTSNFGSWSRCSASCGSGHMTSARTVVRAPKYGGVCVHLVQNKTCSATACPVDCTVRAWTNWQQCSNTCSNGYRVRSRAVVEFRAHGGKPCPALQDAQVCNPAAKLGHCKIDCTTSSWGSWSNERISCGHSEETTRKRRVITAAEYGGKQCGVLEETKPVTSTPCPCILSDWDQWTFCDRSCGDDTTQTRQRHVVRNASVGGQGCGQVSDSRACGPLHCPYDCHVSEWSPWSTCTATCNRGSAVRNRKFVGAAEHGGKSCPVLSQTKKCFVQECKIICSPASWEPWSKCSQTCGEGSMTRTKGVGICTDSQTKQCHQPPCHAGADQDCPEELVGTPACLEWKQDHVNTSSCADSVTDSSWSEWSACDKTCGVGSKQRVSKFCVPSVESETCTMPACVVDCEVSGWSVWSFCSKTCGTGIRHRMRTIIKQEVNGGFPCPPEAETALCTDSADCPNCEGAKWAAWGPCSKSCGFGVHYRIRAAAVIPISDKCQEIKSVGSCFTAACGKYWIDLRTVLTRNIRRNTLHSWCMGQLGHLQSHVWGGRASAAQVSLTVRVLAPCTKC
jgi:hypothetical protein